MAWFPFSSKTNAPKYHNLASGDDEADIRLALAKWKQRCHVLGAIYVFTVLIFGVVFLLLPARSLQPVGMLSSDAIFGDVPKQLVLFNPNQTYVDEFPGTLRNLTVWDMLIPLGSGFIAVQNPVDYGLQGGFPVSNTEGLVEESYSISMFHQLHCLAMIKSAFGPRDRGQHEHLGHCFDYLRQSIMCAGDTALEKAVVDADGVVKPAVDGWGVVHECRSWDAIFDFATLHRVTDKEGAS